MQTKALTQTNQLQHSRVFTLDRPSNSVVANMAWQLNQQFKQTSNYTQICVGNTKCFILVRVIFHDAVLLLVQSMVNSLDPLTLPRLEQNELHFWKRDQGAISNV